MVLFSALLVGVYAVLQQAVFARPAAVYYVEFSDAGGLSTGARVLLAGVNVGTVTQVDLLGPNRARATLSLDRELRIPEGTRVYLPTSLIGFGDRQVLLVAPEGDGGWLEPGSTMEGSLQSPLAAVLPGAEQAMTELNQTLQAVQGLLGDEQLRSGLAQMVESGTRTSDRIGRLAQQMDGLVTEQAPQIDTMLGSMERSLANLEAVSAQVKAFAESGQLEGKTVELLNSLNVAVTNGKALIQELQAMATDPQLRDPLRQILANTKTASESGVRVATRFEAISEQGVTASEETVKLLRKANEIALQLEALLTDVKGAVDRFPGGAGLQLPEVEFEGKLIRQSHPGHTRVDLNATIPVGDQRVVFGLYDAFESNKLTFQFQRPVNTRMDLRYGVYASLPGIGVDYEIAPGLRLRSDAFGLNDTQLDLTLRYDMGAGLVGWAGVERVFRNNSPAVGLSIRP